MDPYTQLCCSTKFGHLAPKPYVLNSVLLACFKIRPEVWGLMLVPQHIIVNFEYSSLSP